MKRNTIIVLLGLLTAGPLLVSCGDDDPSPARLGEVALRFITTNDGVSIDDVLPTGEPMFENEAGQRFSLETLHYLVSRVSLGRTDGPDFTDSTVVYIDGTRTLDRRQVSFSDVPAGTYDRVRFTFGLNAADNVAGGLTGEDVVNAGDQEVINMAWPAPVGGGYHYMKKEGRYVNPAGGDTLTYTTHLGRSNDTHNFFAVDIQVPAFTVGDRERWVVEVYHEITEWYEDPNQYAFPNPPMIMNNPALQAVLKENGATVFSVNRVYQVD